ncbi:iron ABC transporter permease [Frankia sp. QA3]|uniref:FecCD family ABC transporter permease n=1 Tax=Frankia sp. QA3 TaxID=710111 RepID=UPI000269BAEA|nr:Fe(3+)-siderophore ABC transporter permease [Frankia sp. QA3]EIV91077.1 ABC-type Fe3+-siderophore transport system, permease component [Frankia sp. QA3]
MRTVAEDGPPELALAAAGTAHAVAPVRIGPRGRHSGRVRLSGLMAALLALAGMCLLSFWVGANHLPFTVVWRVLWHDDGSSAALIVHDLRIPRTLLGLTVGAALGVAGALTQALTRNDLAEPGLLGVNIGASAAVVVGISAFGVTSPAGYVWFAFVGAGVTSVAVFVIGSAGRGAATPASLVVAGAAATALLGAFVNAALLLDTRTFDRVRFWDVGSLAAPGADALTATAPFIVVGILLAVSLARSLNALALGEEAARGLGVHLNRARASGALAVILLCGAATAAAGPITFVGLAVPHVARVIAGPDHRWVLPYSALLAAILLIGADLVGRVIIAPGELRVGIVTAFVGAPVFIALCRRARLARP